MSEGWSRFALRFSRYYASLSPNDIWTHLKEHLRSKYDPNEEIISTMHHYEMIIIKSNITSIIIYVVVCITDRIDDTFASKFFTFVIIGCLYLQ